MCQLPRSRNLALLTFFFKSLLHLLQQCFCFMFCFSGCGILTSLTRDQTHTPALEGEVLILLARQASPRSS